MVNERMSLYGVTIIASPFLPADQPRLQISPNFPWITAEMRQRIDAELLAMFGRKAVAIRVANTLLVRPEHFEKIKQAARNQHAYSLPL